MKWVQLLMVLVVLGFSNARAESPALKETCSELDAMWEKRGAGGYGAEAIAKAKSLSQAYPNSYDAQWQYGRVLFWDCFTSTDNAKRAKVCKQGWDYSKRATELNSSGVEGYYMVSLNVGTYANAVGVMTAVREGLAGEIEQSALRAAELDPKYDGAGPHRVLGRYYQNLPWPMKDTEKAKYHYDSSIKLAPGKAINWLYIAEYYIYMEQPEEAKKALNTLLDPNYKVTDQSSYIKAKPKAEKLLKGL